MTKVVKQKFDWAAFKKRKFVVSCKTENEAKQFCRLMHKQGMRWINGDSFLEENNWHDYEERTCYFGSGHFGHIDGANKDGITVLRFSLLDFSE